MTVVQFTKFLGTLFLAFGIFGFFPSFVSAPAIGDPNLVVEQGYGRLAEMFPVNVLQNALRVVLGVLAFVAAQSVARSRDYCRAMAIVFLVLAVMGMIPATSTFFGLLPLFSHNIWLSWVIAIASGIYGFRSEILSSQNRFQTPHPRT